MAVSDFETLDSLYTPPLVPHPPSPFGECRHRILNINGTWTCVECGLETNSAIESNIPVYSCTKAYDPAVRFTDLLDSYCYANHRIPNAVIDRLKQTHLTTKAQIRKWIAKNSPEHTEYSVEAYFRATDTAPFDLDPYTRQTLVVGFERFLKYYYTRTNKSAPNLSFCLSVLMHENGLLYPEGSISLPVSSMARNQQTWTDFKIFEHNK